MRCFIAIDMSQEAKEEISRIQKKLPEAEMKLVEAKNLHLTVKFLAELTDSQVNQVKESLKKIKFNKFKARLGNMGVFPSPSFIRVVWVSLEPSSLLKELHEKIHEALKDKLKLDKRFESHITLARVRNVKNKELFMGELAKLKVKPVEIDVNSFTLKKSTLTRQGPVYEDILEFK